MALSLAQKEGASNVSSAINKKAPSLAQSEGASNLSSTVDTGSPFTRIKWRGSQFSLCGTKTEAPSHYTRTLLSCSSSTNGSSFTVTMEARSRLPSDTAEAARLGFMTRKCCHQDRGQHTHQQTPLYTEIQSGTRAWFKLLSRATTLQMHSCSDQEEMQNPRVF